MVKENEFRDISLTKQLIDVDSKLKSLVKTPTHILLKDKGKKIIDDLIKDDQNGYNYVGESSKLLV